MGTYEWEEVLEWGRKKFRSQQAEGAGGERGTGLTQGGGGVPYAEGGSQKPGEGKEDKGDSPQVRQNVFRNHGKKKEKTLKLKG